ncbi:MAG TPA: hypothetical protein VF032_08335 [Thermoleophilaceae bacterium]
MRGALLAGVLLLLAVFAAPAAGQAQQWDGSNPFTCTLQNAASLQDPNADPFCVEYDHSGIDATAIQQLLSDGPNQLAAVAGKCFLYRVDRFTSPLGEVDTAMFANKATGTGGSAITKATVPIPATGSMISVPVVQACTGQQQTSGGGGGTTGGGFLGGLGAGPSPGPGTLPRSACKNFRGNAKSGLGRARLGLKRAAVRHRFGKPTHRAAGYYHYCLRHGGDLAIHFGRHSKTDVVMTSGKSFHAGKVRIGSKLKRVRSALHHEQVLGHSKRDWVIGVTHRRWRLLVGLSKNRVVYIAAVSRSLSFAKLGKILNNAAK